jgi:hypothetical protein
MRFYEPEDKSNLGMGIGMGIGIGYLYLKNEETKLKFRSMIQPEFLCSVGVTEKMKKLLDKKNINISAPQDDMSVKDDKANTVPFELIQVTKDKVEVRNCDPVDIELGPGDEVLFLICRKFKFE